MGAVAEAVLLRGRLPDRAQNFALARRHLSSRKARIILQRAPLREPARMAAPGTLPCMATSDSLFQAPPRLPAIKSPQPMLARDTADDFLHGRETVAICSVADDPRCGPRDAREYPGRIPVTNCTLAEPRRGERHIGRGCRQLPGIIARGRQAELVWSMPCQPTATGTTPRSSPRRAEWPAPAPTATPSS